MILNSIQNEAGPSRHYRLWSKNWKEVDVVACVDVVVGVTADVAVGVKGKWMKCEIAERNIHSIQIYTQRHKITAASILISPMWRVLCMCVYSIFNADNAAGGVGSAAWNTQWLLSAQHCSTVALCNHPKTTEPPKNHPNCKIVAWMRLSVWACAQWQHFRVDTFTGICAVDVDRANNRYMAIYTLWCVCVCVCLCV